AKWVAVVLSTSSEDLKVKVCAVACLYWSVDIYFWLNISERTSFSLKSAPSLSPDKGEYWEGAGRIPANSADSARVRFFALFPKYLFAASSIPKLPSPK